MTQRPGTDSNNDKLRQRNRELFILSRIAESLNREVDLGQALLWANWAPEIARKLSELPPSKV
jgi:hypothetical protein